MPPTDTGNFNRFLTSLGLLFLGASLVVPYFFFRSTDVLDISRSDLRRMTVTGKDAVVARQQAVVDLEPWVIGLAISLVLAGAVLVVVGASRLKSAQDSDDEEAELRKRKARLDLEETGLSPGEQEERFSQRAQEEGVEEGLAASSAAEPALDAPVDAVKPSQHPHLTPPAARQVDLFEMGERKEVIARISRRIEEEFAHRELESHTMRSQLRISSTAGSISVDGMFDPLYKAADPILLQTKVILYPPSIRNVARLYANDFLALLARYELVTEARVRGWLVMVVPTESEGDADEASLEKAEEVIQSRIGRFGKATIIREAEIPELPGRFAEAFSPWQHLSGEKST